MLIENSRDLITVVPPPPKGRDFIRSLNPGEVFGVASGGGGRYMRLNNFSVPGDPIIVELGSGIMFRLDGICNDHGYFVKKNSKLVTEP